MPVALMLKVAASPGSLVIDWGCAVMVGASLTVKVAALLVADPPTLVTTQS